ncbi:MAG: glycosyltransferase family 4 protein [Desulfobacterota bacterium]|jgi:glycosyltransferase involved in cell wall biosynthesis|nr:glycosyltransferase family 4 protein [Thermodesulfobacteriota bacterium]
MRIAFICPWYGKDIPGGAEAECRRTVENLHQRGLAVEVWTTCVRDFEGDWSRNHYRVGDYQVEGVPVKRFAVTRRDGELFHQLNQRILAGEALSREEEKLFLEHMINSPGLYQHLQRQGSRYLLVFIPYLFSTTYFGSRIHPERSLVIPCLHDEGYARLALLQEAYSQVRGLVFHTTAEMELGRELFRLKPEQCFLFGEGIDTDLIPDPGRFRRKYALADPYLLYAGRRDAGKNTPLLMNYFTLFKKRFPSPLRLVLIGNLPVRIPLERREDILDFGFVPRQDKIDAYGGAALFCQPSVMESFSIVIMEAWLCGAPVLVNAHCPVTVEHCQRGGGGLYFGDYLEFEACLQEIQDHPDLARALADNGRRYVLENFHWDRVTEKFLRLFTAAWEDLGRPAEDDSRKTPMKSTAPDRKAIHQILPNFSYGDAIGNDVLGIQKVLRNRGLDSEIYAQHIHPRLAGSARPYWEYREISGFNRVLIFHFSIGSELTEFVRRLPDRKILIYHNITPPHFFRGINPEVERRCALGLEELKLLAPHFDLALGVSEYNRRELERAGYKETGVLPIFLDFQDYYLTPEEALKKELDDGRVNILHVGRIAPQKKIEDLIRVFYLFQKRHCPESRLILVGTDDGMRNYGKALKKMAEDLGLLEKVRFAGFVTFRELVTYYGCARAYLCLSEHEGFCVPLMESMFFGLPVLAYLTGGIPETLGGAGIGIKEKNWEEIAELLALVVSDQNLREKIVAGQKERLKGLSLEANSARLQALLEPFL